MNLESRKQWIENSNALPRTDSLAEGNGSDEGNLSAGAIAAARGNVRDAFADHASNGVGSGEYSGGMDSRVGSREGSVFGNCPRVTGRDGDISDSLRRDRVVSKNGNRAASSIAQRSRKNADHIAPQLPQKNLIPNSYLLFPHSWKGAQGLAEDIRYYGRWMRAEAERRIGHLYPKVKLPKDHGGGEATVIAWLWARTVASPNPAAKGTHVPLVRSFWLSTKTGKKAWVEPVVDQATMSYRFEIRTGQGEPRSGTVSRNGGICLLTGSPMPLAYIRAEGKAGRMGARLMAIVAEGKNGRIYLPPDEEQERIALSVVPPDDVPDTDLPKEALGFRVQNYGMTKHRHLFTNRQLVALTTFCDLVGEAREKVLGDSSDDQDYADAVMTYLAFSIGKVADRNSTIATWAPNREHAGHTFTRQAISMTWDFAESNVLSDSSGNFYGGIKTIQSILESLVPGQSGFVLQRSATMVESANFIFSTDPPYYDNVPYADLSDFFYVWLRRCLQPIHESLFGTMLVPKTEELVADPFRQGGKDKAKTFFEIGMGHVFKRLHEASDLHFPATIYYAFKQAEDKDEILNSEDELSTDIRASTGWETFLQGLIDTGWQVDGTWPMRTELGRRMRNFQSNALTSSIVLVCRPRPSEADIASRRDFLAALKRELPEALRHLQKGNIAPVDLAQAAIGPGMAVFSRYARVLENDGSPMRVRTALALINQALDEVLAEQEGEFDADTRWALAWFDQYGFTEGPYGAAETLCTAKNTSMSGMVEAGILLARSGKVRLLASKELPADWNPQQDARLTIWEIVHHLIRALDGGEARTAELLAGVRAASADKAEAARDLAYRLFASSERRKRAQDALGYNALVTSWPEIARLAQDLTANTTSTRQAALF
ncbi:MAG: hypothetical protein U1F76_03795 [Candidatus Competibacteraceae bacterium]